MQLPTASAENSIPACSSEVRSQEAEGEPRVGGSGQEAEGARVAEVLESHPFRNRKLEYEELKECTFKPQTNKDVKRADEGLNEKVRGIDKYIQ